MIRDMILFVVLIFVVAVSIVIVNIIYDGINQGLQASDQVDADNKALMQEQYSDFSGTWDYVIITAFIGVVIGILALAYALASTPVFFFAFVIVVVILSALAGFLANSFYNISEQSAIFAASAANFPLTSALLNNYMLAVIVMIFLMLIVFFAKPNDGGGFI